MSRTRVALLVLLAALGTSTCSGPVAGELTLSLVTPNADDGAIVFSVRGSTGMTITGATAACGGCRLFAQQVGDSELRAVVTGDLSAGPLVRIAVSDTRSPSNYAIAVRQVASRSFALRQPIGYRLTLEP